MTDEKGAKSVGRESHQEQILFRRMSANTGCMGPRRCALETVVKTVRSVVLASLVLAPPLP